MVEDAAGWRRGAGALTPGHIGVVFSQRALAVLHREQHKTELYHTVKQKLRQVQFLEGRPHITHCLATDIVEAMETVLGSVPETT